VRELGDVGSVVIVVKPVFAILQSLEIILIMILDELLGRRCFLPRDRRGDRNVGARVKISAIVSEVNSAEPHGSIVTVHWISDDEICDAALERIGENTM